ncbi:unnamed protein product [Urochloa humidicola]
MDPGVAGTVEGAPGAASDLAAGLDPEIQNTFNFPW